MPPEIFTFLMSKAPHFLPQFVFGDLVKEFFLSHKVRKIWLLFPKVVYILLFAVTGTLLLKAACHQRVRLPPSLVPTPASCLPLAPFCSLHVHPSSVLPPVCSPTPCPVLHPSCRTVPLSPGPPPAPSSSPESLINTPALILARCAILATCSACHKHVLDANARANICSDDCHQKHAAHPHSTPVHPVLCPQS